MARLADKPTIVFLGTYVGADLADDIKAIAKRNDRSVSAEMRIALEEHKALEEELHKLRAKR